MATGDMERNARTVRKDFFVFAVSAAVACFFVSLAAATPHIRPESADMQRVVDAAVTGDLGKYGVKLPTAHDGLAVNFGTEYRQELSELHPDAAYIAGDGAGQGAPTLPTIGGYHVFEGFTEARLPILEDMPGAKSLSHSTRAPPHGDRPRRHSPNTSAITSPLTARESSK